MSWRLRPDLCLIRCAPTVERTASGLHLAHALPPAVAYGKVVQCGADVQDVAPGDVVAFPPSASEVITHYPSLHVVVSEAALDAVVERTTP